MITLATIGVGVIGFAALLGLPLRLSPALQTKWIAQPRLPLIGVVISGAAIVVAAALSNGTVMHLLTLAPAAYAGLYALMGLSWIAFEFFLLHWWAPVRRFTTQTLYRQAS